MNSRDKICVYCECAATRECGIINTVCNECVSFYELIQKECSLCHKKEWLATLDELDKRCATCQGCKGKVCVFCAQHHGIMRADNTYVCAACAPACACAN